MGFNEHSVEQSHYVGTSRCTIRQTTRRTIACYKENKKRKDDLQNGLRSDSIHLFGTPIRLSLSPSPFGDSLLPWIFLPFIRRLSAIQFACCLAQNFPTSSCLFFFFLYLD